MSGDVRCLQHGWEIVRLTGGFLGRSPERPPQHGPLNTALTGDPGLAIIQILNTVICNFQGTNHCKPKIEGENGAIIGKAMTSLKEGKGLVLVLVTLQ